MKKSHILVEQSIIVTCDEGKFTDEFLAEFRQFFYPFHTLDDHLRHLAQLYARGLVDDHSFIEGYGNASEMGISFSVGETETTFIEAA